MSEPDSLGMSERERRIAAKAWHEGVLDAYANIREVWRPVGGDAGPAGSRQQVEPLREEGAFMSGTQPVEGLTLGKGEHEGIRWALMRGPVSLNGYVRLPEGHPWRKAGEYLYQLDEDNLPVVHGGITYGPDEDGWIGFDTAHHGDRTFVNPYGRTWTEDDVTNECKHLCGQVAEAMKEDQ